MYIYREDQKQWKNVFCYVKLTDKLLLKLDLTRTTRTPAFWGYPSPHDYPYYWVILDPKSKEDKVKVTNLKNLPKLQISQYWNNLYMRHTFWSCLIRCANIKWFWRVLLKIQSGHDYVHRRTDGQTDGQGETSIPPFHLRWSEGYKKVDQHTVGKWLIHGTKYHRDKKLLRL